MTTTRNPKADYFEDARVRIMEKEKFVSDGKFLYHFEGVWQRFDGEEAIRKMRAIIEKEFKDDKKARKLLSTKSTAKRLYEDVKTSPSIPRVRLMLRNSPIVAIENGKTVIDLSTMKTRLIKPEDHQFWAFNYAYCPEAKWSDAPEFCEFVKKSIGIDLLNGDKNDNKRKHLIEILAYLCTNIFGAKKMVVFLGPPSCGKSVLLKLLKMIVGEDNFAPLSLSDLGDKFRAELLQNIHLIINDELPCRGVRNLDILKKVISGEEVIVEKKKGTPFALRPAVKVVFAANQLPRLAEYDSGNAFAERMTVLRFGKSIPRGEWQLDLAERLFEERDVIVSCALKEASEFIARPIEFTVDTDEAAVLRDYEKDNDSVNEFIHDAEYCVLAAAGMAKESVRVGIKAFYDEYARYCEANAITAATMATFRQQMAQLGFDHHRLRYQGRSVSCYPGIGLKNDYESPEEVKDNENVVQLAG